MAAAFDVFSLSPHLSVSVQTARPAPFARAGGASGITTGFRLKYRPGHVAAALTPIAREAPMAGRAEPVVVRRFRLPVRSIAPTARVRDGHLGCSRARRSPPRCRPLGSLGLRAIALKSCRRIPGGARRAISGRDRANDARMGACHPCPQAPAQLMRMPGQNPPAKTMRPPERLQICARFRALIVRSSTEILKSSSSSV